jgi:hypothetical protein
MGKPKEFISDIPSRCLDEITSTKHSGNLARTNGKRLHVLKSQGVSRKGFLQWLF